MSPTEVLVTEGVIEVGVRVDHTPNGPRPQLLEVGLDLRSLDRG